MDSFIPNTVSDADVTGPKSPISQQIFRDKYALPGETFKKATGRLAASMADDETHRQQFLNFLRHQITIPGGRIWCAMGAPRQVTAFNCFVSGTIEDSLNGPGSIMNRLTEASITMQKGGGIGYDFSTLRPLNAPIKTLGSHSSGPISFMEIFNSLCGTIRSAGHRRGAQMGMMRVDHPDIIKFVNSKNDLSSLTNFNISVACTDKFMEAVEYGKPFDLVFEGKVHDTVDARALWNTIMQNTWHYAEPGVIFIDRMNSRNNLYYCETIASTNPCGEQPLPPFGACLLGSINIAKLVKWNGSKRYFDWDSFKAAIPVFVGALDNVIDRTIYPLPEQEAEAKAKRRQGGGVTGMADGLAALGFEYGTDNYIEMQSKILRVLRDESYRASVERAKQFGAFPMFDRDKYIEGECIKKLPSDIQDGIYDNGIRNALLNSIAPTGTISLFADNVSSGIEPPFAFQQERDITLPNGHKETVFLHNYAVSQWGVYGRRADEVSVQEHVAVMAAAQEFIDASTSKTCNVGPDVTFTEFSDIYMEAYRLGANGCTTFRANGYRRGILRSNDSVEGAACTIDALTGQPTCS